MECYLREIRKERGMLSKKGCYSDGEKVVVLVNGGCVRGGMIFSGMKRREDVERCAV